MHSGKLVSILWVSGVLILAGCGADSSAPAVADSSVEAEAAQLAAAADTGATVAVPVISERTYTAGTAHAKVTGFFSANGSVGLNLPASVTSGDQTWLQYGNSGAPELNIGVTSNQYDIGVTVVQGPYTVTAGGTDCRITFDVTPVLLSGKFSCPGAIAYDKSSGSMGPVDIEATFDAST